MNETAVAQARGVIASWHADEGWGAIDSPATPGGCWVHCSALDPRLGVDPTAGTPVIFDFRPANQEPYAYAALRAWPVGQAGPTAAGDQPAPPSPAYRSELTVQWRDGDGPT